MATLILVNVFVPSIAFAGTDEIIIEKTQQTEQVQLVEEPVVEEEVTPEIISLSIESNNPNSKWAKKDNIVTINFVSNIELISPTVVVDSIPIGGDNATVRDNNPLIVEPEYQFTYVVGGIAEINDDSFDFTISDDSTELADQSDLEVGQNVTIDNTSPVITLYSDYMTAEELKKSISLTESQKLVDDGVFVDESTGEVVLKTTWDVPIKNVDGSYTYNVTYTAEDNAGNVTEKIGVLVSLEPNFTDKRITSTVLEIELLGDATTQAELGKIYEDLGAKYTWDGVKPVYAWVTGDLNTLVSKDDYSLTYNGNIESEYAPLESVSTLDPINVTRTIKVSDTVAPGQVKDFYLVSGNGYIDLHWVNPTDDDFAGVQIWKSTTEGQMGEMILFTSKVTVSYEDANVLNGTTYYYTLVAVDLSANSGSPTNQLSATPIAPQIVSADTSFGYDSYSYQEITDEKDGEVKSGESNDKKVETENSVLPLLGFIALLILLATGLYLIYLQNPEWFTWLFFWRKKKIKNGKK